MTLTVYIDDAGWSCLVGGMLIGVYQAESGQFDYDVVAPGFFQGNAYSQEAYLAEAGRQAAVCFERMDIGKNELITVCTGYALDGVCSWLAASGYTWRRGKITDPLQDLVEHALQEYLRGLGFEVSYELLTDQNKKGLFWWRQVKWLKGGNPNRQGYTLARGSLCKTGWWSFHYWAGYSYPDAKRLVQQARAKRRNGRANQTWSDSDE